MYSDRYKYYTEHDSEDHSASHRRCPDLPSMKASKFCRLPDQSLLTDLLPEIVSIEKSDIPRYDEKCRYRSNYHVKKKGRKTICHKDKSTKIFRIKYILFSFFARQSLSEYRVEDTTENIILRSSGEIMPLEAYEICISSSDSYISFIKIYGMRNSRTSLSKSSFFSGTFTSNIYTKSVAFGISDFISTSMGEYSLIFPSISISVSCTLAGSPILFLKGILYV
jgi:hypothetical protein